MKRGGWIILILILTVLAIGVAITLFYIFGGIIKEKQLSPEFLNLINQSEQQYGPDNPYVICLFNKTCGGTFTIGIEINSTSNFSEVEKMLNKSGKVKDVIGNTILFETRDIYDINDFFGNSDLTKINLYFLIPDKMNISEEELTSCNADSDCIPVQSGCCGCDERVINKNQVDNLASYNRLACSNGGCAAVACSASLANAVKCIDKTCKFVNWTEAPCDSRIYSFCKNYVPKSGWGSQFIEGHYNYNEPSCNNVVGLCEKNLSKEEIYQRCLNETQVPENYTLGYILMYFDPNATQEDINNFVSQSPLKIQSRLTDYYYEIRESFDLLHANLTLEEKEAFVSNETNNFTNYLNSSLGKKVKNIISSYRVYQPHLAFGMYDNYIIVFFYGNVSLEDSEVFIRSYNNLSPYSLNVINAQPIGIAFVGKGNETGQICNYKDEKILYQVGFLPTGFS